MAGAAFFIWFYIKHAFITSNCLQWGLILRPKGRPFKAVRAGDANKKWRQSPQLIKNLRGKLRGINLFL
jgi:hypothetical protein